MTSTEIYTIFKTWIHMVIEPDYQVGGSYKYPVIRGEQNSPMPSTSFFAIHQPFAIQQYASGNVSKARKVIVGNPPNQVTKGYIDIVNHYQGTLSIEEYNFQDSGDKLRYLLNSLNRSDIKSYFKNSKISILRNEGIKPIPQLNGISWTLKSLLDLIVLFPDEVSYETGFIESVEIDKNLEH